MLCNNSNDSPFAIQPQLVKPGMMWKCQSVAHANSRKPSSPRSELFPYQVVLGFISNRTRARWRAKTQTKAPKTETE